MPKMLNAAAAALTIGMAGATAGAALAQVYYGPGPYARVYPRAYPRPYYAPRYRGGVVVVPSYGYGPYGPPPVYCGPPGPPPPPPPPPRPYPQPEPPAAITPQDFVVYFPFDNAQITPDARSVVQAAAAYERQNPGARVTIVGYTDASGSEGYNQTLSEHRSRAVRAALQATGVRDIDMDWKGKHDLAVATPNGVKEPLNRRVTIVVQPPA